MAGAFYTLSSGDPCTVITDPNNPIGTWCQDCPSAQTHYEVWRWNYLFPAYSVPVAPHCPTAPQGTPANPFPPSGSTEDPVTGDPPIPPAEGCPPATSTPPDDHATSSQWSLSGQVGGHGGGFGYGAVDQMGQPLVIGMTPLATYSNNGTPVYTYDVEIDIQEREDGGHSVNSFHEGTGPGILCFHPPELQDYMLHGSGVNAGTDSRWPSELSEVTVLLHNCERADTSTGDSSVTRLAFGNPLTGSVKPKTGVYFEYSAATSILRLSGTDSSGDDKPTAASLRLDSMALDLGVYTESDRDALPNPRAGTLIWNSDVGKMQVYNGSGWETVTSAL